MSIMSKRVYTSGKHFSNGARRNAVVQYIHGLLRGDCLDTDGRRGFAANGDARFRISANWKLYIKSSVVRSDMKLSC